MLRLGAVWWCGGYLLYILLLMNGPEHRQESLTSHQCQQCAGCAGHHHQPRLGLCQANVTSDPRYDKTRYSYNITFNLPSLAIITTSQKPGPGSGAQQLRCAVRLSSDALH